MNLWSGISGPEDFDDDTPLWEERGSHSIFKMVLWEEAYPGLRQEFYRVFSPEYFVQRVFDISSYGLQVRFQTMYGGVSEHHNVRLRLHVTCKHCLNTFLYLWCEGPGEGEGFTVLLRDTDSVSMSFSPLPLNTISRKHKNDCGWSIMQAHFVDTVERAFSGDK